MSVVFLRRLTKPALEVLKKAAGFGDCSPLSQGEYTDQEILDGHLPSDNPHLADLWFGLAKVINKSTLPRAIEEWHAALQALQPDTPVAEGDSFRLFADEHKVQAVRGLVANHGYGDAFLKLGALADLEARRRQKRPSARIVDPFGGPRTKRPVAPSSGGGGGARKNKHYKATATLMMKKK